MRNYVTVTNCDADPATYKDFDLCIN